MTDYTKEDAIIYSDGRRYYIGFSCMRRRSDYSTPERASAAAFKLGFRSVTIDPCANPNLKSIADRLAVLDGETINGRIDHVFIEGNIKDVNAMLLKLGYKPVRLTRNMLNKDGRVWCIDADTPNYLDPGSEAYHTM